LKSEITFNKSFSKNESLHNKINKKNNDKKNKPILIIFIKIS
jgi:hypothetical protein